MNLAELDRLFEDRANRRWGVFYYCSADPRVIAPSRPTWRGYQINFAHPKAGRVLVLFLGVLLGPVSLALVGGPAEIGLRTLVAALTLGASISCLMALSAYLSKQHAA